jgi:ADP-heptose:LPS heptosyltransferase
VLGADAAVSPEVKILTVVLDNLGDVVLASSLFAPLRRAYPGAELGVFVKEYARSLFDVPDLCVHAADPFWDRAPGRAKGAVRPFLGVLDEIRARRYDAAYVLNADWRRALACRIAGIPVRVGYAQRRSGFFLTDARPRPEPGPHVAALHCGLLPPAATAGFPPRPELGLRPAQEAAAARWRESLGWEKSPLVILHPLSGDPLKNWPLSHWETLGRLLTSRRPDLRVAVLRTEGERAQFAQSFLPSNGFPSTLFQFVSGDLSTVKGILSTAALVIAGDSGPGHVAAALGRPLLSLFGPSDPRLYRAVGPDVRVLQGSPIASIRPDDVGAAALEMLAAAQTS